ncbi:hypothetical protein KKY_669 [Pelagibacterium halotolerans B2]|uniref:Uncharacterized protein n=1 Tax=Pelagibacterium halotolerans (strain DSM 22347 / JCM 15775 / CGMCC 1.7692 / B2) TaxID=1082931 RepID=G4RCN7_PELHB|nr:hypothetical protein KKY_669 [Pelagibacterium halotolerans B2]
MRFKDRFCAACRSQGKGPAGAGLVENPPPGASWAPRFPQPGDPLADKSRLLRQFALNLSLRGQHGYAGLLRIIENQMAPDCGAKPPSSDPYLCWRVEGKMDVRHLYSGLRRDRSFGARR